MKYLIFSILIGISTFILVLFDSGKLILENSQSLVNPVSTNQLLNPQKYSIEDPPAQSLRGNITSLLGPVMWQSRIATQTAQIILPQKIQQGELLETKDGGYLDIEFLEAVKIAMYPKSKLHFIQTLPLNLVFVQDEGKIKYDKLGTIPVSIRIYTLLINIEQGSISILVDNLTKRVYLKMLSGNSTIAYNDNQNLTQVKNIPANQIIIYNYETLEQIF